MNYFLGIDAATGRLVGDFEDLRTTNNNNPVSGATAVTHERVAPRGGHVQRIAVLPVPRRRLGRELPRDLADAALGLDRARGSRHRHGVAPASPRDSSPASSTRRGSGTSPTTQAQIQATHEQRAHVRRRPHRPLGHERGLRERGRWFRRNHQRTLPNGATWVAGAPALDGGPPPPPPTGHGLQIDGVDTHGILLGSAGSLGRHPVHA